MNLDVELHLDPENKDAKKLNEIMLSYAKKLQKELALAETREDKYAAIFSYYRKYYTLTLNKTHLEAGINKSPTRDIILDIPWKDFKQNRFFCLKIWEKINH
jgi:hypothetical protein